MKCVEGSCSAHQVRESGGTTLARRIHFLMALALVLAVLSGQASAQSGNATNLFVSPGGNDGNSGRDAAQPFATIARARDEVRRLRTSGGPAEPVTIYLRGGLYLLREPLAFTPEDSIRAGAEMVLNLCLEFLHF